MKYSLVGLFVLYVLFLNAQQVYYTDAKFDSTLGHDISVIGLLDLDNCLTNPIDTNESYRGYANLTVCPNSKLYGVGRGTGLPPPADRGIDEIDLENDTYTNLQPLTGSSITECIVCSADTILYGGAGKFWKYEINTGVYTLIGNLPNLWTAFDMIFIDGILFGTTNTGTMIQIDIENPENSFEVDTDLLNVYNSMSVKNINCDSTIVYMSNSSEENDSMDIYIWDPVSMIDYYYCTYPVSDYVSGWAGVSTFEDDDPCQFIIDLDGDDDKGLAPIDYQDSLFCLGTMPISDSDVYAESDKPWDSVHVEIVTPQNLNAQLMSQNISGISLLGNNTNFISLYNTGNVSTIELMQQLSNIELIPDANTPSASYLVSIVGFAEEIVSDTAFAYLYYEPRDLSAGEDGEIFICRSDQSLSLFTLLDSGVSFTGSWIGNLPPDGLIFLDNQPNGEVMYIVIDPICGPDTSIWSLTFYDVPSINLGPDQFACVGDTVSLNLPDSLTVTWQDNSNLHAREITETGMYMATAETSDGCVERDSVFIEFINETTIDTSLFLCRGDTLNFLSKSYLEPEEDIIWTSGMNGFCDTIWNITVSYFPSCENEKVFIPNTFTPNNDGINDHFQVFGRDVVEMELEIFDRWGTKLFAQKGQNIFWDGMMNGLSVLPGVYVFNVRILFTNGSEAYEYGNVTVMK